MKQRATRLLFAFLLPVGIAICQVNTASLVGLVRDPSQAVVADAKVTVKNTATGIERSSETNSDGYYTLANLPVGDYDITVEKTGFQKVASTLSLDATEKGDDNAALDGVCKRAF